PSSDGEASGQPGDGVVQSRLLRYGQSQCQGRVSALPWLVRRESGTFESAAARGGGQEIRRVHGRGRRGAGEGADSVRQGRVSLGRGGREPRGLRGTGECEGAWACRRRAGATGLPGRERDLAQLLPHRRRRVAPWRAQGSGAQLEYA